jgi:hypothetical protein
MPRKSKRMQHLALARQLKHASTPSTDVVPSGLCDLDAELYMFEPKIVTTDVMDTDKNTQRCLEWRSGAGSHLRKIYRGDSRANAFKKTALHKQRLEAASSSNSIYSYFQRESTEISNHGKEFIPRPLTRKQTVCRSLDAIKSHVPIGPNQRSQKSTRRISKYDYLRLIAVQRYLQTILDTPNSKLATSLELANSLFHGRNCEHFARSIRTWSEYWVQFHQLPVHSQGKHQKTKSFIDDEDIQRTCLNWIRSQHINSLSSRRFSNWIQSHLHKEVDLPEPICISERTATRWLHALNLKVTVQSKGLYFDGHERPDVVESRKRFLDTMEKREKRMFKFVGHDLDIVLPPDLPEGIRPLVMVVQDESCFSSFDGKRTVWMDRDRS